MGLVIKNMKPAGLSPCISASEVLGLSYFKKKTEAQKDSGLPSTPSPGTHSKACCWDPWCLLPLPGPARTLAPPRLMMR